MPRGRPRRSPPRPATAPLRKQSPRDAQRTPVAVVTSVVSCLACSIVKQSRNRCSCSHVASCFHYPTACIATDLSCHRGWRCPVAIIFVVFRTFNCFSPRAALQRDSSCERNNARIAVWIRGGACCACCSCQLDCPCVAYTTAGRFLRCNCCFSRSRRYPSSYSWRGGWCGVRTVSLDVWPALEAFCAVCAAPTSAITFFDGRCCLDELKRRWPRHCPSCLVAFAFHQKVQTEHPSVFRRQWTFPTAERQSSPTLEPCCDVMARLCKVL